MRARREGGASLDRASAMRGTLFVAGLILLAGGVACGDGDATGPGEPQSLTGVWVGTVEDQSVEMILAEDESGAVEGGGSFRSSASGSRAFQVEGVNVFPDVTLTLRTGTDPTAGAELINFRGQFSGEDRVRGRLNGEGFDDARLLLEKERGALPP